MRWEINYACLVAPCGVTMPMAVAATFVVLSGCAHATSGRDLKPPCASPAQIEGKFDSRAPGFFIRLKPTADRLSVARELAARYGFELRTVLSTADPVIISGPMSAEKVAQLRCDPAVETLSHDAWMKPL